MSLLPTLVALWMLVQAALAGQPRPDQGPPGAPPAPGAPWAVPGSRLLPAAVRADEAWAECDPGGRTPAPAAACVDLETERDSVLVLTSDEASGRLRGSVRRGLTELPACGPADALVPPSVPAFSPSEVLDVGLLNGNPYGSLQSGAVADAFALAAAAGATDETRRRLRGVLQQRADLAKVASTLQFVVIVAEAPGGFSMVTWRGAERLREVFLPTEALSEPYRVVDAVRASFANTPPALVLDVREDLGFGERGVRLHTLPHCAEAVPDADGVLPRVPASRSEAGAELVELVSGGAVSLSALATVDQTPINYLRWRWWVDEVEQPGAGAVLELSATGPPGSLRRVRVQVRDPEEGVGEEFSLILRAVAPPRLTVSPAHREVQVLGSWVRDRIPSSEGQPDGVWVYPEDDAALTESVESSGVLLLVDPLETERGPQPVGDRSVWYLWRQLDTGLDLRCTSVSTWNAAVDRSSDCEDRSRLVVRTGRPALRVAPTLPGTYRFQVVGVHQGVPTEPLTVTVEALYTWYTVTADLRRRSDLSLVATRDERVTHFSVGGDGYGARVETSMLWGNPVLHLGPLVGLSPSLAPSVAGEVTPGLDLATLSADQRVDKLPTVHLAYLGASLQFDPVALAGKGEVRRYGPSPNSVAWKQGLSPVLGVGLGAALDFSDDDDDSALWHGGGTPGGWPLGRQVGPYLRLDAGLRYRRQRVAVTLGPYGWVVPVPGAGPPMVGGSAAFTWYPFGASSSAIDLERTATRTTTLFASAQEDRERVQRARRELYRCNPDDPVRLAGVGNIDEWDTTGRALWSDPIALEFEYEAQVPPNWDGWAVEPLLPDEEWTRWQVPAEGEGSGRFRLVIQGRRLLEDRDGLLVLTYYGEPRMVFGVHPGAEVTCP